MTLFRFSIQTLVFSIITAIILTPPVLSAPMVDESLLQQANSQQISALMAASKKNAPSTTPATSPLESNSTETKESITSKKVLLSAIEGAYASRLKPSAEKTYIFRTPKLRPSADNTNGTSPTLAIKLDNENQLVTPTPDATPIFQFGYDLFAKPSTTSGGRILPSDNGYVLAPGDQISILLWQSVEEKIDAQLDDSGQVYLPKIGQVRLAGLSVGSAKARLKDAYGAFYVNFELDITVTKVRPITIYLVGEVARPGAYATDRGSTMFGMLLASGGPTKRGSLRNVQLMRGGRVVGRLDLYAYLIRGNGLRDLPLYDQDQIFVPAIGDTTLVMGNILRPAIFELLPGETLSQLSDFAGGALPFTNPNHVQISRVSGGQFVTILDTPATSPQNRLDTPPTPLQNGDIVQYFEMPGEVKNYVEVSGNIRSPGRYAFKEGLTVRALVELGGGLLADTDKNRVQISRYISESKSELFHIDYASPSQNTFVLRDRDYIFFYANKDFEGEPLVEINGSVLTPGKYLLQKNMRISDLLLLAKLDPAQNIEEAELYRQKKTGYPLVLNINIEKIRRNPSATENVLLEREDHVFIRASHSSNTKRLIELKGEFVFPGIYAVRDGERLSSIIERAGGFTNSAFLPGAVFTRASAKQGELLGQRRILDDERKQLSQDQLLLSQMGIDTNVAASELLLARRKESLAILETEISKFSGRVVTKLDPYYEFKGSIYDVPLEDKDIVTIPVFPSTVQIIGGVQNPASIIFVPGSDFNYYINQVGGYTEHAFRDGVYIIRANGSSTRDLSKVEVGDVIFVPERVRVPFDWIRLITNVTDVVFKIVLIKKELAP